MAEEGDEVGEEAGVAEGGVAVRMVGEAEGLADEAVDLAVVAGPIKAAEGIPTRRGQEVTTRKWLAWVLLCRRGFVHRLRRLMCYS